MGLGPGSSLLIRRALTEREQFSYSGHYYHYPVVSVWPGPTQSPHPPLYSSGFSPESASFAARHRFGIALGGPFEDVGKFISPTLT